MRIILLTDGIYPYVIGGIQKHSYYLAKYLARQQVYVDLYHTGPAKANTAALEGFSAAELAYISSYYVPFPAPANYPGHYVAEYYMYSVRLYKLLLQNKPADFIYAQGFTGWKVAQAKQIDNTLPTVGANFHGVEMYQQAVNFNVKLQHWLLRIPVRSIAKNTDYLFSLGGKLTPLQQSLSAKPVLEIPIGIEESWLMEKAKVQKPRRRLVFVGRYERRKGIEELQEVLKELIDKNDFEIVFIGPVPPEKQMQHKQVKYLGLVSKEEEIRIVLQNADVLVCPSYSEGMPTVILEAMASRMAVIGTNVGAVSELVGPATGWLIPAGDKAALKEAMLNSLQLPDTELEAKQHRAQQLIKEKYTWETVIQQTLRQIKQISR